MIYRLAEGLRIEESPQGAFLVSLRPLRMLRMNPALTRLVERMQREDLSPQSAAEEKVLESLHKKGFVVRLWQGHDDLPEPPQVSIVIPVKDRADDLRTCLSSLQELDYPQDRLEVIVVDDGSTDATPQVARAFGALVVPSGEVGGGPALARNCGAALAEGEILAFIDSDCTAAPDWLSDLLPAFADEKLAAIGGWVDGMHQGTALDRYEAVMSSLNLGRREMLGGVGEDTFYLPSCNLLVRKAAFRAAGGFNTELQVGEDVDLTWRLRDGGWKIQYLPRGTVFHAHRSKLWPFMRRRFDYGTSEGLLQQLHPVRGKKMLLPPMLSLILLLLALAVITLTPLLLPAAAGILLYDSWRVKRRLRQQGLELGSSKILAARLRALGSLGYYLGYHLLRYYLVPQLVLSIAFPPFGLLLAISLLGVATVDHQVRRARLALPLFWCFYLLEQLSYGCGVFVGCLRVGSFSSYRLNLQAEG